MFRRLIYFNSPLAAVLIFFAGCDRQEPETPASSGENGPVKPQDSVKTIARFYWAGKDHVAADTNSHDLMVIWDIPESVALENQTLDKLASAPWRLSKSDASVENDVAPQEQSLLRPILEDLLRQESYLEISQAGGQFPDLAFAIRIDQERSALWSTNLAVALESLRNQSPVFKSSPETGWTLSLPDSERTVHLSRVGDWTILGLANRTDDLMSKIVSKIERDGLPYDTSFAADWVDAELDIRRIAEAYGFKIHLPVNCPSLTMRVNGNGEFVRTRGTLDFPDRLDVQLEPWNVPTNLMIAELHSMVAVRGIKGLLKKWDGWRKFNLGSPPNQVFSWGYDGLPARILVAAPLSDASNRVEHLTQEVLDEGKGWMTTNELAGFERSAKFHGLIWNGIPFLYPFIKSVTTDQGDYVVAGSVVVDEIDSQPAADLISAIFERTNSVYLDREFTGGQIRQWLYISQFARYVNHEAQLPAKSAGQLWLKAIMPAIGSSGTDITLTGPSQLTFARTSGSGFTAVELHLLADWFESPTFPIGLHTFVAKPDPNAALP